MKRQSGLPKSRPGGGGGGEAHCRKAVRTRNGCLDAKRIQTRWMDSLRQTELSEKSLAPCEEGSARKANVLSFCKKYSLTHSRASERASER